MDNKILLTGSSGFIGKSLTINLLNNKYQVFVILNNSKKNKALAKSLKKNYKNYKPIFINNVKELKKKLSKLKVNSIINLASKYLRSHNFKDMIDLINSNILFTTSVLEACPKKKLKKYINISSVMIHKNSENYLPLNLYAATKKGFLDILKFYEVSFKNTKFYNLFLHDIYGENDKRKKIIHTILENHRQKKSVKISSNKLELNLLNVKDVNQAIKVFLTKKIKPGNYIIKSSKFTNMVRLIKKINAKIDNKIKLKVLNKKIEKKIQKKIASLPHWKQNFKIENDLIEYLNDNN
jgi:CDP-3, 6-dideoxy-D-glycero-L-glycero-4-hexulose-4-reductase|tara:strand:- start:87 stop:971 length:885 start_codon:yes stop_codon:yes gene_type:complete